MNDVMGFDTTTIKGISRWVPRYIQESDGGHLQEETLVFDAWYWDIFVRLY